MYTILNRDFIYNEVGAIYFTNPKIYDKRGFFTVGFNKEYFSKDTGIDFEVIQHNISQSSQNIARGLHFQVDNNQAKIVHCIKGSVIDIIVDLRLNSPFYMHSKAYLLNNVNTYLYVPHGFAHGFITFGNNSENIFEYFVDDIWNKTSEYVLDMQDYLYTGTTYFVNTENEVRQLIPYLEEENNIQLQFSDKDSMKNNKLYKGDNIVPMENFEANFKELVKNNKNFNN